MEHPLKSISKAGIPEALAKVELYRYLNEPEEAESICRDILAVDPGHQLARRMLGLASPTNLSRRQRSLYRGAVHLFRVCAIPTSGFTTPVYCTNGMPRPAPGWLRSARSPALVEEAMRCFAEAEKIRPAGNDDSILRWNRCVRLLESRPDFHFERGPAAFDTEDMPPINSPARRGGGHD